MKNSSKPGYYESPKRGGLLSRLALAGVLATAACTPNANPPDRGQGLSLSVHDTTMAIRAYLSKMPRAKNDSAFAANINQLKVFKMLERGDEEFDEFVEDIRLDDGFQFDGARPSDVVRITLAKTGVEERVSNAVAFDASGKVTGWVGY
ncbi:MAG: hypothetical protein V1908_04080 [Candidatus Peregrinibacteria bacterium]